MAADPRIIFRILAENKQAKKVLDDTASSFDKVESGARKAAIPAAAALGGIALFAGDAVSAASDVEQAYGAVESVFGDTADAAKALASSAASDVGLATSEYAQMAAVLGAQLKNLGTAPDKILGKTDDLIGMGADLAATFGGPTSEAVNALSALLRGERDPIERYGVSIKQNAIDARLAADGITTAKKAAAGLAKSQAAVKKTHDQLAAARKAGNPSAIKAAQAAYDNAKAADKAAHAVKGLDDDAFKTATTQATLALLTEQTADAQGAFARETDTAAHAQQVATASWEDAQAALGQALLPVVVAAADAFGTLAGWIKENATLVQIIIGVVAGLAAAILAVNVAFAAYHAVVAIVTAVQWLLNAALLANPIGLVVIAVAALVAGIILLWNNCETFRTVVTNAFNAAMGVINALLPVVRQVFDSVVGIIGAAVAWLSDTFAPLVAVLQRPFKALQHVVGVVFAIIGDLVGAAVGLIGDNLATIKTGIDVWVKAIGVIVGVLSKVLAGPFKVAQDVIGGVLAAIKTAVKGLADFIGGVFDGIERAINSLPKLPFGASGQSAGGGGGAPVPGLRSARAGSSSRATSGPLTVNVYTTGDSLQAEQAIRRALRRQTRINGGVVPAFGWTGLGNG